MLMLTMSILGAVLQPSKVFGRLPKDDAQDKQQTPPDTSGFRDGARHWRRIRDENRVIQPRPEHPAWKPHQMAEIAENLLLFQRANGGWPKDYDMQAVLNEDEQKKILDTRDRDDTSFDNRNVFPQVKYLAEMYHRTGVAAYGTGCERGLDFMLRAQYPNGGFPQWFPGGKGYHRHITYNDGAMMGVMRTLRDAAVGRDHFEWLDAERRDRAAAAVRLGTDCILRTQIRVGGRLTGWCQQHDSLTLEPAPARSFELASICPQETTEIVTFLREAESQTAEIQAATAAAVQWLRETQLSGIRIERISAPKEDYLRHSTDFDFIVVQDSAAPPIWARHYEIGTNRPVFASRDGVMRYSLSEIDRERRTGTAWYGGWPLSVLSPDFKQP